MTSRELVKQTLEFNNTDGKVPRDLWTLPWAYNTYGEGVDAILRDYPPDIVTVPDSHKAYEKNQSQAATLTRTENMLMSGAWFLRTSSAASLAK